MNVLREPFLYVFPGGRVYAVLWDFSLEDVKDKDPEEEENTPSCSLGASDQVAASAQPLDCPGGGLHVLRAPVCYNGTLASPPSLASDGVALPQTTNKSALL